MAAAALKDGDPARGELVYRRPDLKCITCHSIGGAGGHVGPDMTSLGASAPMDYLVESLYLPNAKIKEGFHSWQIDLTDGRTVTGLLIRETAEELILRSADGKDVSVPRNKVASRQNAPSLMPAGLIDGLFEQEQRDLFRFLGELGKAGPFDVTRSQAAKAWRLLPADPPDAASYDLARRGDGKLPNWQPLTTTTAGALLASEVLAICPGGPVYLATRFEATKAGMVKLKLDVQLAASVWLDGHSLTAGPELSVDLSRGVHTLVLRMSASTPSAAAGRPLGRRGLHVE